MNIEALRIRIGDKLHEQRVGFPRCAVIATSIIEILKESAGEPYKDGQAEEIIFDRKTWLLTLEEEQ
ncbi:MAG: hypothetical protein A2Z75_04420 [Chloroflexi bacterium RBG_13_50_10]|nr:MAG: hypothetical protein A2Z75_04420 [Chloroflexi bacterium RBG_13_50_10]